MAKASDGGGVTVPSGLPVVTLSVRDKGRLLDERRRSRCLSLKWCLITVCCALLAAQLLAVLVAVLLNWNATSLLNTTDVTERPLVNSSDATERGARGRLLSTMTPLQTQIPAPEIRSATPTPSPGLVTVPAGDRGGNTTGHGRPRRVLFLILRRRRHSATDTPTPLPTSPAHYRENPAGPTTPTIATTTSTTTTQTYDQRPEHRQDNILPKSGDVLVPGTGTPPDTARERSLMLLTILRRLHALHRVTSRDMHRQSSDDVMNMSSDDVTGGAGPQRSRREATEGRRGIRRSPVVWPRRLENVGTS